MWHCPEYAYFFQYKSFGFEDQELSVKAAKFKTEAIFVRGCLFEAMCRAFTLHNFQNPPHAFSELPRFVRNILGYHTAKGRMYFQGTDGSSIFSTETGERIELSQALPNTELTSLTQPMVVSGNEKSQLEFTWPDAPEFQGELFRSAQNCKIVFFSVLSLVHSLQPLFTRTAFLQLILMESRKTESF